MIRTILFGMARVMFAASLVLFGAAALMLYATYRILRAATIGNRPSTKREAAFALMQSIVAFGGAVRSSMPATAAAGVDDAAHELVDVLAFDEFDEATVEHYEGAAA